MSNIDKHALREAAEKATESDWIVDAHEGWHAVIPVADAVNGNYIIAEFQGPESKRNRDFVAAANPATVLALLDELDAKDKQIAELSALQGKPIAWESTTPVYVKFITDERYQRLRPGYKKWYKPYRCSQCAAAGKGEAS